MARNLQSILFQGVPGWSLKSFIQIAARVREFVPDVEIRIYITGDAPAPTTDDPQVVFAHRQAMAWSDKELASGKYRVFHASASPDDFGECAVWCYPTHLPQPGSLEAASLAQLHGAIPVFNPIGALADQVFAGYPVYGIPAIDPMVRVRYAYETIRLLTEPALQDSIRVPMMEYARSKECQIVQAASKIDGWMTRVELEWLIARASEVGSVAEVGCWKGRSTTALAAACRGPVWAIDHWQGGKDEPDHIKEAASDDKVYAEFRKNTERVDNIQVIRAPSVEAAAKFGKRWEGIGPDMTFIDAGHGYDDVVADIRAWLPITNRLICGHDYSFTEVAKAVEDELGEVGVGPGDIWYKWIKSWVKSEAMSNAAD